MSKFKNMKLRYKIGVGVASTAAVVGLGGAAFAYFTAPSNTSSASQATVGTSTQWNVSVGTFTGTILPGYGTDSATYTVTNPGSGHQGIQTVTAAVVDDGSGNVEQNGTPVSGCLSTWFTATAGAPLATDIAGGGSTTGSVSVTMKNVSTSQDLCKNVTPDITVTVS